MKIYRKSDLEKYLSNDWILALLKENMTPADEKIRTNQWLLEMDNKRMIYGDLYGDILRGEIDKKTRILDVGGGINALTKLLAMNSDYTLLDFLAHGGDEYLASFSDKYQIKWLNDDWYDATIDTYDIIISNDIFPDVDMRLELFIEKMLPKCKELRILLTWYNEPRFYQMGRRDDPEVLTFLSWDGEISALKLGKYYDRMCDTTKGELQQMVLEHDSIYRNGRLVGYVRLKGYR